MADLGLLISFFAYLIVLAVVGYISYARSSTLTDFILGGRKLGTWVTAISAQASDMSGWLLIGLPGAMFAGGVSIVWVAIGCAAGTLLNWTMVARRIRRFSELTGSLTIPDFLAARFGGQAASLIRVLALITIAVFFTIYISAQFNAAGKTLSDTFEVSYHTALLTAAAVIILYTMLGGFWAVAWTDLIQGAIMVMVLVVLPLIGIASLGGIDRVVAALAAKGPEMVQVSGGKSGWALYGALVAGGLAWGLGYPGMPHIVVRFMAIDDDRKLRRSALISMVWVVLALWGAMALGAVGLAEFGALDDPETVTPALARLYLPGWLAGAVISAIAAAIMSTVDSQILVLGSAVVRDFYMKALGREASEETCVRLSRAVTLAIGVVAVAMCWDSERGVFDMVMDAWSGLAAGFGPAILLSLRWRRTTGWGVAAGMIAGVVAIMFWRHYPVFPGQEDPTLASIIWELLPCFIISAATIITVSLLTPPPDKKTLACFDLAAKNAPLRDQNGNLIDVQDQGAKN